MSENPSKKPIVTLTPEEAVGLVADAEAHEKYFLVLDDLTSIDPRTAEVLAKFKGCLYLNGLRQIDVSVAEALSKHEDVLGLSGLSSLDLSVAEVLVGHMGELALDGLTHISLDLAEILARHVGTLWLTGVTNLDKNVVRMLAKHKGRIMLEKISELDPEIARLVIQRSDDDEGVGHEIFLDIGHIDPSSAKVLAKFDGHGVYLDYLEEISRESVVILLPLWRKGVLRISDKLQDRFVDSNLEPEFDEGEIEGIDQWQPLLQKHPNFKDLVVGESTEITKYLREHGVAQPECFHNLNAGRGGEALLAEALQFVAEQPNGLGWRDFAETFKRNTRKDFEADPVFMTVYLDETFQAFSDYLNRTVFEGEKELRRSDGGKIERSRAFLKDRMNDPQLADKIKRRYRQDLERLLSKEVGEKSTELEKRVRHAQELLTKMKKLHLKRAGEVSYQLGSRSTRDLTWGDKCSDCTSAKIHGMNFWTVPTWATDPGFNFLLQYDKEGKLAHKFGLVWELKLEKGKQAPILTIDSLELANEQKEKPGMDEGPSDEAKEERLMKEAMAFVRSWATDMGLDPKALYSATISNTGTMELDDEYPKKEVTVTKLGVLDAPKRILKKTNPDYEGEVKIYLQSLVAADQEQMAQNQDEEGLGGHAALIEGDKGKDFAAVERCFDQFLRSDSADVSKVRGILGLARTDSEAAARQMRIFLAAQAKQETKQALAVGAQRIDVFLHARGYSLESYLKTILGQTEVSRGAFIKAKLFHLVPNKK